MTTKKLWTIEKQEWLENRIKEMFQRTELNHMKAIYDVFKKKVKICPHCDGTGYIVE